MYWAFFQVVVSVVSVCARSARLSRRLRDAVDGGGSRRHDYCGDAAGVGRLWPRREAAVLRGFSVGGRCNMWHLGLRPDPGTTSLPAQVDNLALGLQLCLVCSLLPVRLPVPAPLSSPTTTVCAAIVSEKIGAPGWCTISLRH